MKLELGAVATGVPTAFLSSMLFRLRLARDFSVCQEEGSGEEMKRRRKSWGELRSSHYQLLRILFPFFGSRFGPTSTLKRAQSSSYSGGAGLSHPRPRCVATCDPQPWAAGLGGANPVREAPGSVAAVKLNSYSDSLLPFLPAAPSPRPQGSSNSVNSGVFPESKKVRAGREPPKPRTEGQA